MSKNKYKIEVESNFDTYYRDTFFNTSILNLNTKLNILDYAIEICNCYHIDTLCNPNYPNYNTSSRQPTLLNYNFIRPHFKDGSHYVIIHRRGYPSWRDKDVFSHNWCGELGFSEQIDGYTFFLFVYISEEKLQTLIDTFELIERE